MNDPVSIIIPVYNARKYLPKCIESVMNQTYKNLEIILSDDGSTDDSGRICDEYAERDLRIKVIHKENGGVSSARNAGLDTAAGKYICFVDSDDYILENYVERLCNTVSEKNADIVSCGFFREMGGALRKSRNSLYTDSVEYSTDKHFYDKLCIDFKANVPWNKIYRADIIRENNIRFPIGLRKGEDSVFVILYSRFVRCAAYISDPLYVYVDSETSVCRYSEKKSFLENDEKLIGLLDSITEGSDDSRYSDSVRIRRQLISMHMLYDVKRYKIKTDTAHYKKPVKKDLPLFLSYKMSLRIKLRYIFMILSPSLFDMVRTVYRRLTAK